MMRRILAVNYTPYRIDSRSLDPELLDEYPEINQTEMINQHGNSTVQYDMDSLWLWTFVDGLLMLAILCGNTLTILAVTLSRRLSSLMSNQFVLNLAISDLTVGLTLPYHLAFYLNTKLGTKKVTCVLRFMLITLACSASILNLIAIAVDRYIAILHPLHYSRYMSRNVTRTLMMIAWVGAVSVSVVPIFWNNWGMADSCDMHKVIPKEYTTNVLAPLFSLIWVVMFVLYWRIWREASLHARRMRTTTFCSAGPNDWKSVQVVLMVLGSFSICWMPYVVVVCTQTLNVYKPHSPVLYKAVFSLAVANSGINPLIYAWKNTGFRRAFLRLLRCQSPDSPEFDTAYRNTPTNISTDRKFPLDIMSDRDQPMTTLHKDNTDNCDGNLKKVEKVEEGITANENANNSIVNNNSVKPDRCRIIENMTYDERFLVNTERCHIIENLGFDDSLDINNIRMIDANGKESDDDSVATLAISPRDNLTLNGTISNGRKCNV